MAQTSHRLKKSMPEIFSDSAKLAVLIGLGVGFTLGVSVSTALFGVWLSVKIKRMFQNERKKTYLS